MLVIVQRFIENKRDKVNISHIQKTVFLPGKDSLKVLATWGVAALVGFPVVYGFTNFMASKGTEFYKIWMDWELSIPFVPQIIWIYFSLNLLLILPLFMVDAHRLKRYCQANLVTLFIAGVIFYFFPGEAGFVRTVPELPIYKGLFSSLYEVDQPHNLFPSLHITFSVLALYCIFELHKTNLILKIFLELWLILMMMSVLFTYQHHMFDIISGYVLGVLGLKYVYAVPKKT